MIFLRKKIKIEVFFKINSQRMTFSRWSAKTTVMSGKFLVVNLQALASEDGSRIFVSMLGNANLPVWAKTLKNMIFIKRQSHKNCSGNFFHK